MDVAAQQRQGAQGTISPLGFPEDRGACARRGADVRETVVFATVLLGGTRPWRHRQSFGKIFILLKFCDMETFPPRKSLGKDRRKTMPGERSFRRKKKRGPLQNRLLFVEYLKVQRKFDNPLLLSIKFWTIRAISNYMKCLFIVYILFNECLLKEKKASAV